MANLNFIKTARMDRLERYMGVENVQRASLAMKDWYGTRPVPVSGMPGNVHIMRGGEYVGHAEAGEFGTAFDRLEDGLRRAVRSGRYRVAEWAMRQMVTANAFPTSLSDIANASGQSKRRTLAFQKVGPTGVAGVTSSLWRVGNQPAAGGAGSAAPGGRQVTGTTTGAVFNLDDVSSNRRVLKRMQVLASVAGNNLLMYDRIFDVAKTMNSTTTESVTGVPLRYQSSSPSSDEYADGNFCFVEVGGTALAATAHNWTTCLYRNQAGTDNQTFPSMTGNSAAIVDRLDHPVQSWFMPLQSGDTGVMDLAQMQCSASVATGAINFVLGHLLAVCPCPIANLACDVDGVDDAFVPVIDGAAIAFLEMSKPSTGATTYNGFVQLVHG